MAHYAYKRACYDIDYEKYKKLVIEFEKAEGREHDGDSNYDGDNWYIMEMWLRELRATNEALAARVEQMREALDGILEKHDPSNHIANCECEPENGYRCVICTWANNPDVLAAKAALATTDDTAAPILAERDARTLRMAIEVADKARLSLADQYGQNIKDECSQMGGNMDWARLEGAVRVVQALRAKADELAKAGALAADMDATPSQENPCSTHPDAPHGFDRTASHSLGRYVCNCEGW